MIKVRSTVVGVDNTKARLTMMGESVLAKLRKTLGDIGSQLAQRVIARAPVKSGDLKSSVAARVLEKPWTYIRSRVSTNIFYARFLERSSKTRVSVKAHMRENNRVQYKVSAHNRNRSGRPLHPFMAPALEDIRNMARKAIDEALGR